VASKAAQWRAKQQGRGAGNTAPHPFVRAGPRLLDDGPIGEAAFSRDPIGSIGLRAACACAAG